jgi:hypothetical protein
LDMEKQIELRFLDTLKPHIESEIETQEQFEAWFWGRSKTFVKQVAQGLRGVKRDDAIAMVKFVLNAQAMRSYCYMAQCIEALMRDFESALQDPLTPAERSDFETLYYPQPALGGLSLILLAEKLEFMEPILMQPARAPGKGLIQTLNLLLFYYGELVRLRREADRHLKANVGSVAQPECLDLQDPSKYVSEGLAQGHEVARRFLDKLRIASGVHCECQTPRWTYSIVERDDYTIWLAYHCESCDITSHSYQYPLDDLRQLEGDEV